MCRLYLFSYKLVVSSSKNHIAILLKVVELFVNDCNFMIWFYWCRLNITIKQNGKPISPSKFPFFSGSKICRHWKMNFRQRERVSLPFVWRCGGQTSRTLVRFDKMHNLWLIQWQRIYQWYYRWLINRERIVPSFRINITRCPIVVNFSAMGTDIWTIFQHFDML